MKTKAAVLTDRNVPWEIMELDVRDPKENEVLIRYTAAGLCHSDMHLVTGDLPSPLPYIGGHEGAGIIEAIGPGVTEGRQGRSRRLRVHSGVRPVPLVRDGPAEPVRHGRDDPRRVHARRQLRIVPRRRGRRRDVHARHVLAVRDDQAGVGGQGRRGSSARGRGAVRLRRADRLGLGRQHRQRPDRRHRADLRHRRDRRERGPGRRACRSDQDHRRRPAEEQGRVRPGDGSHPRRADGRGGDRARAAERRRRRRRRDRHRGRRRRGGGSGGRDVVAQERHARDHRRSRIPSR